MIGILTGPTGSGKTTQLEKWVADKENVAGILMPVLAGERYLYSIYTGKLVPVETGEDSPPDQVVKIGKFIFSRRVFDWGNKEIIAGFNDRRTVIIDEIGPLELNGEGFAPALHTILANKNRLNEIDLILVVRDGLVDQVTEYFKITEYDVIASPEQTEII